MAINNGGRVETSAELYVLEKENIRRMESVMLKSSSNRSYNFMSPVDKDFSKYRSSPIKSILTSNSGGGVAENLQQGNCSSNSASSVSITSYDFLLDLYKSQPGKMFADDDLEFKSIKKHDTSQLAKSNNYVSIDSNAELKRDSSGEMEKRSKTNIQNRSTSSLDDSKSKLNIVTVKSSSLSRVSSMLSITPALSDKSLIESLKNSKSSQKRKETKPVVAVHDNTLKVRERKLSSENQKKSIRNERSMSIFSPQQCKI